MYPLYSIEDMEYVGITKNVVAAKIDEEKFLFQIFYFYYIPRPEALFSFLFFFFYSFVAEILFKNSNDVHRRAHRECEKEKDRKKKIRDMLLMRQCEGDA